MSMVICEKCDRLIDSDDDPDCFVETGNMRRLHQTVIYVRSRAGITMNVAVTLMKIHRRINQMSKAEQIGHLCIMISANIDHCRSSQMDAHLWLY